MSLREKLQKVKAQGYIRTAELIFTRFIPAWIFRFSKGEIFDLDIEKLVALREQSSQNSGNGLVAKCVVDPSGDSDHSDNSQRMRLREFTWSTVPLETTMNDFGYAIFDAQDPQKLLGGLWAGLGSFSEDELGLKFNFTPDQAWLYCAFVHSDARGRGVYKKLISFVAQDLQEKGYSQLLTIVQPWNRISRIMHEKQSRGIVGYVSSLRIFWLAWVSCGGNIESDRRLVTRLKKTPANISIN